MSENRTEEQQPDKAGLQQAKVSLQLDKESLKQDKDMLQQDKDRYNQLIKVETEKLIYTTSSTAGRDKRR